MYDLSAFCFVCLKTNKTLDTIPTNDTEFLTNLKEIGYETDWLIKETSIQICCDCIYLLNVTTNFKELCVKNNETLKLYIAKLKNGAVDKRVDLQVLAKQSRSIFSRRPNGRFRKVQLRPLPPRRQRNVTKTIKPNIVLNLECSVKLKRICVLEEQEKLLDAGRATLEYKIEDGGTIPCDVQIIDGVLIACDPKIIDGGTINDDNASDSETEDRTPAKLTSSPTKSAEYIMPSTVDVLFPKPEDSCLRNIIKSMEHSAKHPQPDTPAEQPQLDTPATTTENPAAQLTQICNIAPNVVNEADRAFIAKLKEEFRKTLITYGNTRIGELCSKYDSSIDSLNGSERNSPQPDPTPMTSKFTGLRPVPLAKLLPKTNLNNNHKSNTLINKNLNKRKAPPDTTTKHSKKPQNTPINQNLPMYQYGPTILANQNMESHYLNFSLTSFPNPPFLVQLPPSNAGNNVEIVSDSSNHIVESDSDVEIISETRLIPDYDNALNSTVIPNEIDSNNSQFANDSINSLVDSAVLLNCEVMMDESTENDRVEKCMLCNTVNENPNSNYCEPCFNRLNVNLQQKNEGTCINCNKLLGENNASMFCADCNKITVTKTAVLKPVATKLPTNVFGSLFSQCVICCKICRNLSGVLKPNIVCHECGSHGKIGMIKLFNCDMCQYKFVNSAKYDEHVKEHLLKAFECPACLKRFSTKRYLLVHSKRHSNCKCSVCGEEFVDIESLREHRKLHPIVKDTKCLLCNTFFTKNQYKRHLKQVHPNTPLTYVI